MVDNQSLREMSIEVVPAELTASMTSNGFKCIQKNAHTTIYFNPAIEVDVINLCDAIDSVDREGLMAALERRMGTRLTGTPDSNLALLLRKFPKGLGPHDGIELELMLSGKKYVAMLETVPAEYGPHLESGWLGRVVTSYGSHIIYVSGREGQAQRLLAAVERARMVGWVETLERDIGELLGYERSDIDVYIHHISCRLSRSGPEC